MSQPLLSSKICAIASEFGWELTNVNDNIWKMVLIRYVEEPVGESIGTLVIT